MSFVASRELRNDTAGVLRRVEAGEDVTITVNGRPVARMVPLLPPRRERRPITRKELIELLRISSADPGLTRDLADLSPDTTDDLDEWPDDV